MVVKHTYELAILTRGSAGEDGQKKLGTLIETLVAAFDGTLTDTKYHGKRTLAYQILKEKEGFYSFITLSIPPDRIKELKAKLRVEEAMLRILIIRQKT